MFSLSRYGLTKMEGFHELTGIYGKLQDVLFKKSKIHKKEHLEETKRLRKLKIGMNLEHGKI